ncbi:MAG: hypothetical protein V2I56_13170 [Desulfobacteraceae bacterium]|jgi:hypothetical protein|nr:hypothetical protein [Desulfobacteraceae bacterium]
MEKWQIWGYRDRIRTRIEATIKYGLGIFAVYRNFLFLLIGNYNKVIMFLDIRNLTRAYKEKYDGN